jgi:16S rRNA (guanine(527)-N(7))-methyltransferase RsmG
MISKKQDIESNDFLKKLRDYRDLIIDGNKSTNLMSKKIDGNEIDVLIKESLCINKLTDKTTFIDAGSGSGIPGVPIALSRKNAVVFLVEPRKKKNDFLIRLKNELNLKRVTVVKASIKEFFQGKKHKDSALLARGFPDNEKLLEFLKKKKVEELIIITSENKIKKMEKAIELFKKTIYNVPFRNQLKILKLENVSRETRKE